MKFFWCFDQKPPLLYNYVFTEVVPFRKYCHIYIVELLPYCTNVTKVCRNSILYYNFLTLEQIIIPTFYFAEDFSAMKLLWLKAIAAAVVKWLKAI